MTILEKRLQALKAIEEILLVCKAIGFTRADETRLMIDNIKVENPVYIPATIEFLHICEYDGYSSLDEVLELAKYAKDRSHLEICIAA